MDFVVCLSALPRSGSWTQVLGDFARCYPSHRVLILHLRGFGSGLHLSLTRLKNSCRSGELYRFKTHHYHLKVETDEAVVELRRV